MDPILASRVHDYHHGGSDSNRCEDLQLVDDALGRFTGHAKTHTLWALGFLITFTLGGISGMFFPVAGLDTHFHDSYFVVAHFHYVFIGGTVFALFSGCLLLVPEGDWT